MADFSSIGGVGIMGFISPMDTRDTYAVIDPLYGIDGVRNVVNIGDLDTIPYDRRRSGMIVGGDGGNRYFKLKEVTWSFDISDWQEIYLYTIPQSAITTNEITGGSVNYSTQTLTLSTSNGSEIIITGVTDTYIIGGTYNSSESTLELVNNYGDVVEITGFSQSQSVSVQPNSGLGLDENILFTTYNTLLDSTLEMASTIGGLPAGTSVSELSGRTFVSILDEMFFPTLQPTYTIPTISISNNNTTVEVGSTYSINLTANATKNDAGNFTYLEIIRNNSTSLISTNTPDFLQTTNLPDQYGYVDPNNPNYIFSLSYSESYVIPTGVTTSSTTYKSRGNYLSGLSKKTNKGLDDTRTPQVRSTNAPQLSSNSFDSSTKTITGIFPYYYGKSSTEPTIQSVINSIVSGTANKVLSSASGNLTITYNASTEFLWFAHLSSYGLKSQWYVAADNKGLMSTSSLFDPGSIGIVSSELGYWSNASFYIYLGNYATTLNTITLGNGLF
jgi:hypothetical protein